MKMSIAAVLVSLACAASAETPALNQLLAESGREGLPAVAAVAGKPVGSPVKAAGNPIDDKVTIACTMDVSYRESVSQIIFIRYWKELKGTAVISCNGIAPVKLALHGEGLSLGVGLPNKSPFRSENGVVAGNLQLRLPTLFVPKQLEGTYHNAGGEVFGAGISFSPWVNTDGSFDTTIYLPNSFNASAAINLTTLKLTLIK